MIKVLSVFGTRPEAIKMAPVCHQLALCPEVEHIICVSGQHQDMVDEMLAHFGIEPTYRLDLKRYDSTLSHLHAALQAALDPILVEQNPDWVLVQGDTTTALVAALTAFYRGRKIAHIEAGLRTYQKLAPYPEEINRRIISLIADKHFAPTEYNRQCLLAEHVANQDIVVTGNTVIDALHWTLKKLHSEPFCLPPELACLAGKPLLLVTGHRRESLGSGLHQLCDALELLASSDVPLDIVFPVHPNPLIKSLVHERLDHYSRIHLLDPLPYPLFVWLMEQANAILTDSGGVQEEAVALGKPLLIVRETTERQEGLQCPSVHLIGMQTENIVQHVLDMLVARPVSPPNQQLYGDGLAARRIVQALLQKKLLHLQDKEPALSNS